MRKYNLLFIYSIILLGAFSRFIPHPPGFTPIGALGLFSGTYINKQWAWLIPITILLIGDVITGFYEPIIMLSVYISFAFTACVGRLLLSRRLTVTYMVMAILIAESVFFILSNASVWWVYYPRSADGLLLCYINGLPYLWRGVLADMFYCAVLFGGYEYFRHNISGKLAVNAGG